MNIKNQSIFGVVLTLGLFVGQNLFAATIQVNSGRDSLLSGDGLCTLREAIVNANNNAATSVDCTAGLGKDTITFDSTLVTSVCLDKTASGSLSVTSDITINGNPSSQTIIDGGNTGAGGTTRCAHTFGAGIFNVNAGTLTLNRILVKNGNATTYGGGIYAQAGATVNVNNSTVSGNSSPYGGGILADASTVNLYNSTVSGNVASIDAGGVMASGSSVTLTNTTVAGNSAPTGGGILATASSALALNNSTVSGNTALSTNGGGIFASTLSTVALNNATIADNVAALDGGGIYTDGSATVELKNTISAGNIASTGSLDCYGTLSSYGYNLVETYAGSGCILDYSVSAVDSTTDIIDQLALIGSLASNGGVTLTYALDATSPAIDHGDCTNIGGTTVTTDQRGQARTAPCDIGSYEVVCGDNRMTGNETCDDGNTTSWDGCSATCTLETDADADGYYAGNDDCNDADASINPAATEVCDAVDNNCDGNIDEGLATATYYADADADGFGNASASVTVCAQPTSYVTDNTDCNDSDSIVHPGATEVCDAVDNNCDGSSDEGLATATYYADADADGFGNASASVTTCSIQPAAYVTDNTDCDDSSAVVYPSATDTCGDTIDQDCSGADAICPDESIGGNTDGGNADGGNTDGGNADNSVAAGGDSGGCALSVHGATAVQSPLGMIALFAVVSLLCVRKVSANRQ